jgi:hypothetical protein
MPLILTQNEVTVQPGHDYADRTGVSYEYPQRYRKIIQPGERFIYYMGRRRRTGGNAPQVYFGSGVIGQVQPSPVDGERLVCAILDYAPFAEHLFFKDAAGAYRETGAATHRGYFRNGVRVIDETVFDSILATAKSPTDEDRLASGLIDVNYATAEVRTEIERYSVDVALSELRGRHPEQWVLEMPHNNPGYDIRVGSPLNPLQFVEVKGTQRIDPVFFLSEGERVFSHTHADRYQLMVVYNIDLAARTHSLLTWDGALAGLTELEITQWRGRLPF